MNRFSYLSARATLRTLTGVSELSFSGVVCQAGLNNIKEQVLLRRPLVVVSRFDKCLMLMRSLAPACPLVYKGWAASSVLVASDEQYDMCKEFAVQASRVGLMRVVFRASQVDLAWEFAQDQARSMLQ